MTVPTGNETQRVTIGGAPIGGTFPLTFDGQQTAGIAPGASSATVKAALVALSNIGPNDVDVTGPDGGPWVIEFKGALRNTNVPTITSSAAALVGDGDETVTIATLVAGNPALTEAAKWNDVETPGVNTRQGFPGEVPPAGSALVDDDGV